jgi:hypothetical protein
MAWIVAVNRSVSCRYVAWESLRKKGIVAQARIDTVWTVASCGIVMNRFVAVFRYGAFRYVALAGVGVFREVARN